MIKMKIIKFIFKGQNITSKENAIRFIFFPFTRFEEVKKRLSL